MITRIDDCGPSLTDQDIDSLESRIGSKLPVEYRHFLLRHNGGRPTPNAFPIEGFPDNPFGVIQVFFRVNGSLESSNAIWNWEVGRGRMPSNLLPIACDDGGDLICLSLFGEDAGAVLFWDFYGESPEPSYSNVYRIARTFAEFLDGIREIGRGRESLS